MFYILADCCRIFKHAPLPLSHLHVCRYTLQATDRRLQEVLFFRDSSIRACRDRGSKAVQTIEAAHLNLEGRKKAEIRFPHNFTMTAF